MFPAKNLNLPAARTHPLDQPVHLVRLARRLPDLGDDHVGIEPTVAPRRELEVARLVEVRLDADEHVLLGVVEPVACSAGADDALELVGFNPDDFVDARIPPYAHAFSADLHSATGDPKEEHTFVLQVGNGHGFHFVVIHGSVRKLLGVSWRS